MPPGGAEHDHDDPDGELVPKLVEKVALPVVHHAVECWVSAYSDWSIVRICPRFLRPIGLIGPS
eukprot:91424-Prorocentrum_minimum.AAC.1